MRRLLVSGVWIVTVCAIALPAQAGFRSLAAEIEMHDGVRRVGIPFLGVGRLFVRLVQPDGLRDLKMAIFEDRGGVVLLDLESLVHRHVDIDEWSPMIRANSRKEDAHIFIQQRGRNVGLLIAARDDEEVVVIEMELDPELFRQMVEEGDFLDWD